MRLLLKSCFICFSVLTVPSALSTTPLQVLVGMNKPPYIQVDSSDGYEIELLREIAQRMAQQVEFTYVPNKRILTLLQQGIGDIATLQKPGQDVADIFYSCPYIRYQNVAVTLAANQLVLNSLLDLDNLSILAFQNATLVLPDDYRRIAMASPSYRETVDPRTQVDMLQKQRVQVVVMDMNIFHYYNSKTDHASQVQVHALYTPTLYRAAFRDAGLAVKFNQALQQFQQSAAYPLLQERYFGNAQAASPPPCLP
ncbi:transporter substrate-binding domain-containing protein [Rheinheimera sp. F8]|uniref:substrate-binding periplasmic protein n=1 Tax=Rheinheimera sp. F8 TaxID=1763998 RepID=UPI00074495D9|nr:transporter substrate-binding domain-containing protein [Rheinheimera sp. F8]ALZ75919.1 hypothetical protein ATY27_09180 [Rheinheimera sp. F8]